MTPTGDGTMCNINPRAGSERGRLEWRGHSMTASPEPAEGTADKKDTLALGLLTSSGLVDR